MRRPGQWHMGDRGLETHTAAGEGVDRRSGSLVISVAPDVIGAKRINRHEEHIGPARRSRRAGFRNLRTAADSEREKRQREEEARDERPHGNWDERTDKCRTAQALTRQEPVDSGEARE